MRLLSIALISLLVLTSPCFADGSKNLSNNEKKHLPSEGSDSEGPDSDGSNDDTDTD